MWILVLVLVLLAAHLNLTALVPLQVGGTPPPWWVGGRLVWPFAVDTSTLIAGDLLNTLTPLLAIASAIAFLMAAAALLRWFVPAEWFRWLIVAGAILSIALQAIWITPWAILPLALDFILLWLVFSQQLTVAGLRG